MQYLIEELHRDAEMVVAIEGGRERDKHISWILICVEFSVVWNSFVMVHSG
jgi:hypothetical protein